MRRQAEQLEAGFAVLQARVAEDLQARARLRWALVGAIATHSLLFAVHWPAVGAEPLPEVRREPVVARVERYVYERSVERPPRIPTRPGCEWPRTPAFPEPLEREEVAPGDIRLLDFAMSLGEVPVPPLELSSGPNTPEWDGAIVEPARPVILDPQKRFAPEPVYPRPALAAKVEGVVILECTIDCEGRVIDVTVLRPAPLGMTEAAVDAVRQWRFEPSYLNGRAVEVVFVLTVRFIMPR